MTFKDLGWMTAEMAKLAHKLLEQQQVMIEINNSVHNMEKKEPKRDKNGRFTKKANKPKVEVSIEVEPKTVPFEQKVIAVTEDEYEQLKLEHDAFKILAEKYMGKYLNKCYALKIEEGKHLFCLDALREAYMQIGWFTRQLSWWTKRKYRNKMQEMERTLDRMFLHAESLDRE